MPTVGCINALLYVGSIIKFAVDVLLDDATFADALVSEKDKLVLGLVSSCGR